jgi:hypothetical protein
LFDIGGSASPQQAQAAAAAGQGPGSRRHPGNLQHLRSSSSSSPQQAGYGGLQHPLSLPSPSTSAAAHGSAWDGACGIDTGSSCSSQEQQQRQQQLGDTGGPQPLEDSMPPHVSRSASWSSLQGGNANPAGGFAGQSGGSILGSRPPSALAAAAAGQSSSSSGSSSEPDMQKR